MLREATCEISGISKISLELALHEACPFVSFSKAEPFASLKRIKIISLQSVSISEGILVP